MVYFNWLGNWKKLNDDDSICGGNPLYFVENTPPDLDMNNNFVEINYQNQLYYVHVSQVMWIRD